MAVEFRLNGEAAVVSLGIEVERRNACTHVNKPQKAFGHSSKATWFRTRDSDAAVN
jgi:hypothetical protein